MIHLYTEDLNFSQTEGVIDMEERDPHVSTIHGRAAREGVDVAGLSGVVGA